MAEQKFERQAEDEARSDLDGEPRVETGIVVRSQSTFASPGFPPASPSVVPPTRNGVVEGSRRWLYVAKHYAWTSVRSPRWWFVVAITVTQVGLIAYPVLTAVGLLKFISAFGSSLVLQVFKHWKQAQPAHRLVVERNYDERKLALYKLIHAAIDPAAKTPPEIETFQREALQLIAGYVRDHRKDWNSPTIFANLLVEDGDDIVVIARDRDHRHGMVRYPKSCMLAAKVFMTGQPALTGDVYRDFPATPPGKAYRSVLAIPVHRDTEVVAVVSVDSPQAFHFDLTAPKLCDWLRPYVALLSWTLPKRRNVLYLPKGLT